MVNAPGPGPDATETAQAEGEGPDGADSRPLQSEQHPPTLNKAPSAAQTAKPMSSAQPKLTVQPATPAPSAPPSSVPSMNGGSVPPTRPPTVRNLSTSGSGGGVGLPSPDTRTFPKEPGLTHADLAARSPAPTPSRAPSQSGASARSASSLSPASSISDGEWSQPPTPIIPSTVPPTAPPSRRPSIFRRASGSKSNKDDPTAPKRSASVKSSEGGHKFTLKDLLASGPKLGRRSSQRSVSSQKSDSDGKSAAGDSTASLLKKYGVCEKVAIGKGATSVVRLAHKWDRTEEKLYAVKEFRKRRKNETEKDYVKKLTAEFCISSTLHHVNVVETVDLVQDEAQHWCEVMEFCPGGDLYAAIKKGGMSPSEVECCFKQIISGVFYLHGQGVAHRDIKPENLLFDLKGHLKIGDFGASTVYRLPWEKQVHMSTGLCGSEPYIAPEQFLGKPYDARLVDVWACGIVYYCLHFQEIPWRVAQQADQLYATYASACASTNAEKSNFPPTITNLSPRACRPLIRKMLEPDPKKRWSVEEVMKHAWMEGLEVCYSSPKPGHIHVNATALAQAHISVVK